MAFVAAAGARPVWQILPIYVAASWIVLQIIQALTEDLGLPVWFPPFAVVLLVIGLPIVLVTAFVQAGLSPATRGGPMLEPGVTAAPEGALGRGQLSRLFTWRNAITGGVLALALWGVLAIAWLLFRG